MDQKHTEPTYNCMYACMSINIKYFKVCYAKLIQFWPQEVFLCLFIWHIKQHKTNIWQLGGKISSGKLKELRKFPCLFIFKWKESGFWVVKIWTLFVLINFWFRGNNKHSNSCFWNFFEYIYRVENIDKKSHILNYSRIIRTIKSKKFYKN